MIREFQILDTEQVMKLWFWGNVDAHPFVSEEYWHSHFNEVQEALLQAKVFVYDINGKVLGFIGLMNEYIAGIFVDRNYRSSPPARRPAPCCRNRQRGPGYARPAR